MSEEKKSGLTKKVIKEKKLPQSTIRVKQIGSPIGRKPVQRKTLIGLGLNRMHRVREIEDTPSTRGMVAKISHLVRILD